jgi:hypothetical protein
MKNYSKGSSVEERLGNTGLWWGYGSLHGTSGEGDRKHPTLDGHSAYKNLSTKHGGTKLRSHEIIIIIIITII